MKDTNFNLNTFNLSFLKETHPVHICTYYICRGVLDVISTQEKKRDFVVEGRQRVFGHFN